MGYGKNEALVKNLIAKFPKEFRESVDRAIRADEDDRLDTVWESCRSLQEREQLVNIYLKSRDFYDKIKDSESIWMHVFTELGFNEIDNPFLTFFKNFNWDVSSSLYPVNVQEVCNAYANGVIDSRDFANKEELVYNPNLYSKTYGGNADDYLDEWTRFKPEEYKAKLEAKAGRTLDKEEIKSFIFFGIFDAKPNLGVLVPMSSLKKTMAEFKDAKSDTSIRGKKLSDLLKYDTKSEAVNKLLSSMSDTERAETLKALFNLYKDDIS